MLATPSLSPTTPAVTAPIPTETPFYQQAPFIIGMIVLGVVVIFVIVALVIFLLVRPRGDSTYKSSLEIKDLSASGYSKMEHSSSPPRSPQRMQEPKHVTPSPKHMTGSWSPGDPYDVSHQLLYSVAKRLDTTVLRINICSVSRERFLIILLTTSLSSLPREKKSTHLIG